MRTVLAGGFFVVLSLMMLPMSSASPAEGEERRGCCSHHRGVCGCNSGHTMCCDGSQSPSCTCVVDDGLQDAKACL